VTLFLCLEVNTLFCDGSGRHSIGGLSVHRRGSTSPKPLSPLIGTMKRPTFANFTTLSTKEPLSINKDFIEHVVAVIPTSEGTNIDLVLCGVRTIFSVKESSEECKRLLNVA
jgi:hypothetical protein